MDVALLVGFAASGPLDVPVAVEDAAAFEDIFGPDVVLARRSDTSARPPALPLLNTPGRDSAVMSRLGASVRSFFAAGGRRCWAVRVAGPDPETSRFEIPGLLQLTGSAPEPAVAWARSAGSWADSLRVGSALLARTLVLRQARQPAGQEELHLTVVLPSGDALRTGDLVRVVFPALSLLAFLELSSVEPAPSGSGEARLSLSGKPFWFAALGARDLDLDPSAPPEPGSTVPFTEGSARRFLLVERASKTQSGAASVCRAHGPCFEWRGSGAPPTVDLAAARGAAEALTFELWARRPAGTPQRVTHLGFSPRHARYWKNLPSDEELFLARLASTGPGLSSSAAAPDSPAPAGREQAAADVAAGISAGARFPLAGAGEYPRPSDPPPLYLPLGMPSSPEHFLSARRSARDEAARDGLDAFPAAAFLDPDAIGIGTGPALTSWAEYWQYLAPEPRRRRLRGIFAAFSVPEVSLLAIPDALHAGWRAADVVLPPAFEPPAPTPGGGFTLRFRSDAPLPAHHVIEERFPGGVVQSHLVSTARFEALPADPPDHPAGRPAGTYRYRVRANPSPPSDGGPSLPSLADPPDAPWSEPLFLDIAPSPAGAVFDPCSTLAPPDLLCPAEVPEETTFEVRWTLLPRAGRPPTTDHYVLEEGADPGFTRVTVLYEGSGVDIAEPEPPPAPPGAPEPPRLASLTLQGRPPGDPCFRVRVLPGTPSPQALSRQALSPLVSPGRLVRIRPRTRRVELAPPEGVSAAAVAVHEHALRLCAARGDVLAVLALPSWYREDAALVHVAALRDHFGERDPRALTYGAVYHPWLVASDTASGQIRPLPPDGAACGALARVSLTRAAWIAAANEPLRDVVSLTPALLPRRRDDLAEAQINVVVHDPRGFLVKSEDTLSVVPELLPIHVRRLLILLRRTALELGAVYAFEPNGAALERTVERAFGGLLRHLHERGALSAPRGTSPFRLRVASGARSSPTGSGGPLFAPSPGDPEGTRLSVDIAVAPAGAIEVITLRLVQSGAQGFVLEGA